MTDYQITNETLSGAYERDRIAQHDRDEELKDLRERQNDRAQMLLALLAVALIMPSTVFDFFTVADWQLDTSSWYALGICSVATLLVGLITWLAVRYIQAHHKRERTQEDDSDPA